LEYKRFSKAINEVGIERLRQLALDQQEIIEMLRQTVKVNIVERLKTATFDL